MFDLNQVGPIKSNPQDNLSYIRNRPSSMPNSRKQFKDVLDNKVDDKEEENEVTEKDEQPAHSIFDLSKKKPIAKKGTLKSTLTDVPATLAEGMEEKTQFAARKRRLDLPSGSGEEEVALAEDPETSNVVPDSQAEAQAAAVSTKIDPRKLQQNTTLMAAAKESIRNEAEGDMTALAPKEKEFKANDKSKSSFSQENSDLTFIPPSAQPIQVDTRYFEGKQPLTKTDMQALVDKIVESMQVIKKQGLTETVIDLKHPPMLEGSRITLTSFDEARNEFKIAFSNLTDEGKLLIDRQLMKDSLKNGLESQGFVIHQITTQIGPEIATQNEGREDNFARRDSQEQPQDQRRNKNQNRSA